jgi:hypothetical protein
LLTITQTIPDTQAADSIFNGLKDSLKDLQQAETPFEEMKTRIRDILKPIENNNADALERAIYKLNSEFNSFSIDIADSLTRILLRDPENIFKNTRNFFIELSHLINRKQAGDILDIVKGYWVHPEAASLLSQARNEQIAVAINGLEVHNFTGDCYARQAWPSPQPYKVVALSSNDRDFNKIEQTLLREVPHKTVPDRLRKQELEKFSDPLLLVFPFPNSNDANTYITLFPEESLLDEIKSKLNNVTMILATGQDTPPQLNYVTILEPLLKPDEEDKQIISCSEVNACIDDLKG